LPQRVGESDPEKLGAKDAESEHDLQCGLFVGAIIKDSSDSALRQALHFGGEFANCFLLGAKEVTVGQLKKSRQGILRSV
jgi:hypothetical protein